MVNYHTYRKVECYLCFNQIHDCKWWSGHIISEVFNPLFGVRYLLCDEGMLNDAKKIPQTPNNQMRLTKCSKNNVIDIIRAICQLIVCKQICDNLLSVSKCGKIWNNVF